MQIPLTHGQVAIIDGDDLSLVSTFKWRASYNNHLKKYYATASIRKSDGKQTTLYMHRLITGCPKGKEVDHCDHDTLNNRRGNLFVGSHKDNMANGKFSLTTICPRGHPYDKKNTYVNAKGKRICRACNALRVSAVYANETPAQREKRRATVKAYYNRTKP